MAKEIAFVMPYFGRFKPSFALWLESVARNPEIDWIIFTDNDLPDTLPTNVRWNKTTLNIVQELAVDKLGCYVDLKNPYKLCDLKPLFGAIFSDYLKGYNYWGYGDFDVIYGRLFDYLKKIEFRNYDKINRWGHCTLIRNTEKINKLPFSKESLQIFDIYKMLRDGDKNYGFDETKHNNICWNSGLEIYIENFSADIDIFYERMRCVDKRTMVKFCKVDNVAYAPVNYPKQIFVSDHGKVFRLFIRSRKVFKEEFAYIHYRQEAPIMMSDKSIDTFIISRYGFFDCDADKLDDYNYVERLIKQYNLQTLMITEILTGTELGKWMAEFYKDNRFFQKLWRKIKG